MTVIPFENRQRRWRHVPWSLLLFAACDAECNKAAGGPPRTGQEGTATQETTAFATPARAGTGNLPSAPGSDEAPVSARPSIDENMGRGFQGTLELRVSDARGARALRYLAKGNTARFQLDGAKGGPGIDALLWGENVSLLDHRSRTYHTRALDDVNAPAGAPEPDVKVQKTGERVTMQGVMCERYLISEGPQKIDACVTAVPGEIDVAKFEALSRMDVPAWVEGLLDEDLFPLTARVNDAAGKELYRLELVTYSPGPVADAELALPSNYKATP
jgi:hypothetical protein